MQRNFTNPSCIFFCIFGVIIPDIQLLKCTKTRVKSPNCTSKVTRWVAPGGIESSSGGWPTVFLQYFDAVGWVFLPVKLWPR